MKSHGGICIGLLQFQQLELLVMIVVVVVYNNNLLL